MTREIDLGRWPRRKHFELFRDYESPFFSLCAEVDVTTVRAASKRDRGPSLFAATLHASLLAANSIEEFGYRIRGERVVAHDVVHAGSTILREDDTFGFGYFPFDADFDRFQSAARAEIERVRASGELVSSSERDDLIRYSVIPWVRFTSFSHAQSRSDGSIPKIVFGRVVETAGRSLMPVSVDVHHALMDGLHVGKFLDRFQLELDRW